MIQEELSGKIIGAAMDVLNQLRSSCLSRICAIRVIRGPFEKDN
jgi:hypothetical protein